MAGYPLETVKSPFCRDSSSWWLPQVGASRMLMRYSEGLGPGRASLTAYLSVAIAPLGGCRRRSTSFLFCLVFLGVGCLGELRGTPGVPG